MVESQESKLSIYDCYVGRTDWKYLGSKGIFKEGIWKCNLFVQEVIQEKLNLNIKVGKQGHPNTSNLLDPSYEVPNCKRLTDLSNLDPSKTYIITRENLEGGNHCGLVLNDYVYHATKFEVEKTTLKEFLLKMKKNRLSVLEVLS